MSPVPSLSRQCCDPNVLLRGVQALCHPSASVLVSTTSFPLDSGLGYQAWTIISPVQSSLSELGQLHLSTFFFFLIIPRGVGATNLIRSRGPREKLLCLGTGACVWMWTGSRGSPGLGEPCLRPTADFSWTKQ